MKVNLFMAGMVVALLVMPCFGEMDMGLVLNARPASLLIDASGDKFSVTKTDETGTSKVSLSSVYAMPNISAGLGLSTDDWYIDITGGAGVIINDTFRSFLLQASVAAHYAASESFNIGPRVGLIYCLNPEWLEDDSVEFDETVGLLAGIQLSMGDKIMYLVSVDIVDASFDVDKEPNVTADDSSDLNGLAIQFGVRGEF